MLHPRVFSWCAAAGLALVAAAGCDHSTEFDGPNLTDRFGDFNILDGLAADRDSVDFAAGEAVVFTARFNKQTDWVLEVVGDSSGAVKRFEGSSNELTEADARWTGRTTDLPFFKAEPVTARLFFPDEEDADTSTTSLGVLAPRQYEGVVLADFEEDAGAGIFVGNFEFEFDLPALGRSQEVPAMEGDFFYLLRSTGGPVVADPFFIGLVAVRSSLTGETYVPVPTSIPEDLYFNVGLYSFGTPNTIAVLQVATDTNGNGAFDLGTDMVMSVFDAPVDWDGWRLVSVPMSETGFTEEQLQEIVAVNVLLISDDNAQPDPPLPVDFGMDYITFTAGGPLQP